MCLLFGRRCRESWVESAMGVADISRSGFVGATAVAGQHTREREGSTHEGSDVYLHSAVERGEVDAVYELLVNKRVDAGSLDSVGRTPLLLATQCGHSAVVAALLEFGAGDSSCIPPDGPNGMGALVKTAVRKGYHEILRVLIDHGADVDAADDSGSTPLQHAAMLGKTGSIDVLVACDADVDSVDLDGCTALHWAAMEGHGEAIVALLRNGADIDALDNAGRTPLHRACAIDDTHATEAAEFLLLWGADDAVVDNSGRTAEHYIEVQRRESGICGGGSAKQRAHESLLQLLKTTPADRAWCRHGLVILCKARLGHGAIGTVLDRLVTLEEEELFEKTWAMEAGDGADDVAGGDGSDEAHQQEKTRNVLAQQDQQQQKHGDEPMIENDEPQPRKVWNKPLSSSKTQPRKDQAWIKPRHEEGGEEEEEGREKQGEKEEQRRESQQPPSQKSRDEETPRKTRSEQSAAPSEFAKFYRLGKKLETGKFSETYGATERGEQRGSWIVKRAAQRRSPSSGKEHGLVEEVGEVSI